MKSELENLEDFAINLLLSGDKSTLYLRSTMTYSVEIENNDNGKMKLVDELYKKLNKKGNEK